MTDEHIERRIVRRANFRMMMQCRAEAFVRDVVVNVFKQHLPDEQIKSIATKVASVVPLPKETVGG